MKLDQILNKAISNLILKIIFRNCVEAPIITY